MICYFCGGADVVRQCPQCQTSVCWDCRPNDTCPTCGAQIKDNAKCSVTGGCGDGSQEEP